MLESHYDTLVVVRTWLHDAEKAAVQDPLPRNQPAAGNQIWFLPALFIGVFDPVVSKPLADPMLIMVT